MREPQLCPHCSKPLQPVRYGVAVSAMAIRILDTLDAVGAAGVAADELFKVAYGNKRFNPVRLSSYVSALNRALGPNGVAIRSERCIYRLTRKQAA